MKLVNPLALVHKSIQQPSETYTPAISTTLNKPFINKHLDISNTSSPITSLLSSSISNIYKDKHQVDYEIKCIIHEKFLFDKRPEHAASEVYKKMSGK